MTAVRERPAVRATFRLRSELTPAQLPKLQCRWPGLQLWFRILDTGKNNACIHHLYQRRRLGGQDVGTRVLQTHGLPGQQLSVAHHVRRLKCSKFFAANEAQQHVQGALPGAVKELRFLCIPLRFLENEVPERHHKASCTLRCPQHFVTSSNVGTVTLKITIAIKAGIEVSIKLMPQCGAQCSSAQEPLQKHNNFGLTHVSSGATTALAANLGRDTQSTSLTVCSCGSRLLKQQKAAVRATTTRTLFKIADTHVLSKSSTFWYRQASFLR